MDERTPYERLGGDSAVRALVDTFYDVMEARPEAATIRAMHPKNLQTSRDKLYEFLSGWLGGPQLYIERHGHPRLRARHLPFAVDTDAAVAWVECMDEALLAHVEDEALRDSLASSFRRIAGHMRNQ